LQFANGELLYTSFMFLLRRGAQFSPLAEAKFKQAKISTR